MTSKYATWSLEALWSYIIQPPCSALYIAQRNNDDNKIHRLENAHCGREVAIESNNSIVEANESELYDVLREVVLRRDDYPPHILYPPDVRPALLHLLAEHHPPYILLLVCHILVQMCSSCVGMKERLAQEGVIQILMNIIRSHPVPVMYWEDEEACGIGRGVSSLPHSCRLVLLLLVQITAWMQSFALGPPLCIAKLNECDAARLLSRMIDSCNPHVFRHGSTQSLQLLVVDRTLIAKRYEMKSSSSSSVCYELFGDAYKCCMSLYNGHYLLDLYDTSGADDIYILEELCSKDEIWRYEDPMSDSDLGCSVGSMEAGQWVDVRVTNIINSSYFWAVFGEDFNLMDDIREMLDIQQLEELDGKPKPGQHVIALKPQSKRPYRAQVITLSDDGLCDVFAIDYGFVETAEWLDLRKLPAESKLRISGLTHLCKIMGARQRPISCQLVENILGALCNLTSDATSCSLNILLESRLIESLFSLCTCPDIALRTHALRVFCNLCHRDTIQTRLARSGICSVVIDTIGKYLVELHKPQCAQLIETCVTLLINLMYECDEIKETLTKLNGIHMLLTLTGSDVPVVVRDTVLRALKVYLDGASSSRKQPCRSGDCIDEVAASSNFPRAFVKFERKASPRKDNSSKYAERNWSGSNNRVSQGELQDSGKLATPSVVSAGLVDADHTRDSVSKSYESREQKDPTDDMFESLGVIRRECKTEQTISRSEGKGKIEEKKTIKISKLPNANDISVARESEELIRQQVAEWKILSKSSVADASTNTTSNELILNISDQIRKVSVDKSTDSMRHQISCESSNPPGNNELQSCEVGLHLTKSRGIVDFVEPKNGKDLSVRSSSCNVIDSPYLRLTADTGTMSTELNQLPAEEEPTRKSQSTSTEMDKKFLEVPLIETSSDRNPSLSNRISVQTSTEDDEACEMKCLELEKLIQDELCGGNINYERFEHVETKSQASEFFIVNTMGNLSNTEVTVDCVKRSESVERIELPSQKGIPQCESVKPLHEEEQSMSRDDIVREISACHKLPYSSNPANRITVYKNQDLLDILSADNSCNLKVFSDTVKADIVTDQCSPAPPDALRDVIANRTTEEVNAAMGEYALNPVQDRVTCHKDDQGISRKEDQARYTDSRVQDEKVAQPVLPCGIYKHYSIVTARKMFASTENSQQVNNCTIPMITTKELNIQEISTPEKDPKTDVVKEKSNDVNMTDSSRNAKSTENDSSVMMQEEEKIVCVVNVASSEPATKRSTGDGGKEAVTTVSENLPSAVHSVVKKSERPGSAVFIQGGRVTLRSDQRTELCSEGLLSVTLSYIAQIFCSFLNSGGGRLYFGIARDGTVEGVPVSQALRSQLCSRLSKLIGQFSPAVPPHSISVALHRVLPPGGGSEGVGGTSVSGEGCVTRVTTGPDDGRLKSGEEKNSVDSRRVIEITIRHAGGRQMVPYRVSLHQTPIGYMRRGTSVLEMAPEDDYKFYIDAFEEPMVHEIKKLQAEDS